MEQNVNKKRENAVFILLMRHFYAFNISRILQTRYLLIKTKLLGQQNFFLQQFEGEQLYFMCSSNNVVFKKTDVVFLLKCSLIMSKKSYVEYLLIKKKIVKTGRMA